MTKWIWHVLTLCFIIDLHTSFRVTSVFITWLASFIRVPYKTKHRGLRGLCGGCALISLGLWHFNSDYLAIHDICDYLTTACRVQNMQLILWVQQKVLCVFKTFPSHSVRRRLTVSQHCQRV